jgi:alanine racemase
LISESQKQFFDIFKAMLYLWFNISRVIGIGETLEFKDKFVNCITFNNTAEFISNFDKLSFANETILIKGARSFQFEEIVYLLEEDTWDGSWN